MSERERTPISNVEVVTENGTTATLLVTVGGVLVEGVFRVEWIANASQPEIPTLVLHIEGARVVVESPKV